MQSKPNDETLEETWKAINDAASSASTTTNNQASQTLAVQAAVEEAVKNSDFDKVIKIATDYGEPKEGSSEWWYFAMGMAMILKGEHQSGYEFCKRAESLVPDSYLVHGCLGVGAKGMQEPAVAVRHFEVAYANVVDPSKQKSSSFPSLGFYASPEDLQVGILSTLHDTGDYERCLLWYSQFTGIPTWDQGGSLMLALTQLQWTEAMIAQLETVEKHGRENGALNALPIETKLQQAIEHLVGNFGHVSKLANDCLLNMTSPPVVTDSRAFNKDVIDYLYQQNQQNQQNVADSIPA